MEDNDMFILQSQYVAADGLVMQGAKASPSSNSDKDFINMTFPCLSSKYDQSMSLFNYHTVCNIMV